MNEPDLRYPVGKFLKPETVTPEQRHAYLADIEALPARLRAAVAGLNDAQLDTPYRPGGWTVRQVVHHVGDSHMNSFLRFRWALTEDEPTIKPYDEGEWAKLADMQMPVEISLTLLDSLHARMMAMLSPLTDAQFARTFRHPEAGLMRVDTNLALYSWHSRHHVAHITSLRQRSGW